MKINQLLIPPFLRKFDAYLLARYPIIWETKIHFILFYSAFLRNLLLIGIGYLFPLNSITLMPYQTMVNTFWKWGMLVVGLIFLYYAYQQSFSKIQFYTIKQNMLRYGLYLVSAISLYSNVMILPNTLIYRIRQLYDYQTLNSDFIRLQKSIYSSELIKFVYWADIDEKIKNQIFVKIKNTDWLNQNQEYQVFMNFKNDLERIIDKRNIEDYKQKIEKIKKLRKDYKDQHKDYVYYSEEELKSKGKLSTHHLDKEDLNFLKVDINIMYKEIDKTNWPNVIKKEISDKIDVHNVLFLSPKDFENCNYVLLNPLIQKYTTKYTLPPFQEYNAEKCDIGYESRKNHIQDLISGFGNLMNYHHIDYTLMPNTISSNQRNIFESRYNYLAEMYLEKSNTDYENRDFVSTIPFIIDSLLEETDIIKNLSEDNIGFRREQNYSYQATALMLSFLSLLLLTAKLFTLRNIFIAGFLMIPTYFILISFILINNPLLHIFRKWIFQFINHHYGTHFYLFTYKPFLFFWYIPFTLIILSFSLAIYLIFRSKNFIWLSSILVFLLSSATLSGLSASFFIFMENRPFRHILHKKDDFLNAFFTLPIYFYPLLLLSMFLMYAFYNHLSLFPKRK